MKKVFNNQIIIQQAPIVINTGDPSTTLSSPLTTSPTAVSNVETPGKSVEGFNQILLPELNRLFREGKSATRAALEVLDLVEESFASKDALYNILILNQSSFENDSSFLDGLRRMIESWLESTRTQ